MGTMERYGCEFGAPGGVLYLGARVDRHWFDQFGSHVTFRSQGSNLMESINEKICSDDIFASPGFGIS